MPTSSRETPNRTAIPLQIRWQGKATNAPPSHNAYTRAYFSRAILGPWGSLVYPWWFGTTRLRFKSGRTHLQSWFGGLRDSCKLRLRTFASPSFPFGLDRVLDRCSRRGSRVRKGREDHPSPPHDRLERHKARKPGQRQNASNEEQGEAHGRIQLGAPDDEEEDPPGRN